LTIGISLCSDKAEVKKLQRSGQAHFQVAPLHQTPFCRIALLFAACACDSKVSLLAGYKITK